MFNFQKILHKILLYIKLKPILPVIIITIVCGFFIIYSILKLIPPPDVITHYRFTILEKRINLFLKTYTIKELNLKKLPKINNESDSIYDGWKHEIKFNILSSNEIELISYGKDGIPGGFTDFIYKIKIKK